MSDSDIIKKSYEDMVGKIFDAYYNEAFISKPTPTQLQQAEAKFRAAIVQARQARDKAIQLLP
jgi:hypothetical protein